MRTIPILLAALFTPLMAEAQVLRHTFETMAPDGYGQYAVAVSGVSDVDGDGVGDVIIGAPEEDGGQPNAAGRVYVYSGATGARIYTLISPNQYNYGRFGFSVSGVSDVDGDGVADFLVGAPGEAPDGSPYGAGRAYVFSGATGGLVFQLASPNEEFGSSFGRAVAGSADLDGDGRGELLVTAQREGDFTYAGRVYVLSGSSGVMLYSVSSPNAEESGYFGSTLSYIPDVNGDGVGDLLVGTDQEDPGTSPENAGRAYVFSGATGTLLHELASPNEEEGGFFGHSVAGVPDFDGDGRDDLLIGAPDESPGASPTAAGRAYLFSSATGSVLKTYFSPSESEYGRFGFAVSSVPDLDGDGRDELLIGAPYEGENSAGRAYVLSEGRRGPRYRVASALCTAGCRFGSAVAGVPDVFGGERGGFLVGAHRERVDYTARGRAYLYSGPAFTVAAIALNSPVPRGARLHFSVTLGNNTPDPISGDLALDVIAADSTTYARTLASGVSLGGLSEQTLQFALPVSTDAPLGYYTATVTLLEGGADGVAEAVFGFVVVPAAQDSERLASGEPSGEALGAPERLDGDHLAEAQAAGAASGIVVQPNPAQDRAAVAFTLEAPSQVRLALYDVLGRAVLAPKERPLAAGRHHLPLDLATLPPGTYFVRLETGARVRTVPVTLNR